MISNPADPVLRVHHPERLDELLAWAIRGCGLGTIEEWSVLDLGYDDCNVAVTTARGRYVVKVFTRARPVHLTQRYVNVVLRVLRAGVAHPRLYTSDGHVLLRHQPSGNLAVVMDLVGTGSFLDRGLVPGNRQLDDLLRQVRLIHAIDCGFPSMPDWWATPNIAALADEVWPLLDDIDRRRVEPAVAGFGRIRLETLPHAFVHGDLTRANVVPTSEHTVAILDFAVANRYPRIHELAMIAVNLLHGEGRDLAERLADVVARYQPEPPLTPEERAALPWYVFATAAMELLGSAREAMVKVNRGRETTYLLQLGRETTDEAQRMLRQQAYLSPKE